MIPVIQSIMSIVKQLKERRATMPINKTKAD